MLRHLTIACVLAAGPIGLALCPAAAPADQAPVRVGMIDSLFDDQDESKVLEQMKPFADWLKKQTGINGEFVVIRGADAFAKEFKDGKVQLGVLHGIEFARLREQLPEIKPLVVAVNETTELQALILVAKDSPLKTVAELKGKKFVLASRPPQHVRFFLERSVKEEPKQFFQLTQGASNAAAIDGVIDGTADATIVSNVVLEAYRGQKPGRFARLRVLSESPVFPAAVVVYRPGKTKEETVRQFRDNLLKADQTAEGRQTLTLWRLTGFQDVPKDYDKQVENILKAYPSGK